MKQKIKITKGLNISIKGQPEQRVDCGSPVKQVAVMGPDYVGLKPKLLVKLGQAIGLGEPLFFDKRDAKVMFVSPGTGRIVAINRARRRKLQSIVVELDETQAPEAVFDVQQSHDRGTVRDLLLRSGLWTSIRTRPYNRVADSTTNPRAIFITAIDTRPLSVDPQVVIARRERDFEKGIATLRRLGDWPVFLCTGPNWSQPIFEDNSVTHVEFTGPHPAGLPGTHIHYLQPAAADCFSWHIAYQDVIAIGHLFETGRLLTERVVSIGGPGALRPRALSTRLGANVMDLVQNEIIETKDCRVISGSVLDGQAAEGALNYIGRYHNQISIVSDSVRRRLFGWFTPRSSKTPASQLLAAFGIGQSSGLTTACNGRRVAMMPVEAFEQVMPLNILPTPLLRAMLVKDTDAAQALGCLELAEEDLALMSFVCPAKQDYASALRTNLDQIEREG